MTFKQAIGKIHLWLGLATGLVVFVISLAAALFVFERELTALFYRRFVFVDQHGPQRQPLPGLLAAAQEAVPGREVAYVDLTPDTRRCVVFQTYRESEQPGWTCFSELDYWDLIYVNPYTGRVQGVVDMRYEPIRLFREVHQRLLLRYDTGHLIVGVSTLIFFALVLTGLILWYPRNRAARRQRFTVRWTARWRRVNYDLHSVGGFYVHLFALLLAATGLVWTFEWWTDGIYRLLGDDPRQVFRNLEHPPPAPAATAAPSPLDRIVADLMEKRAAWENIYLELPAAAGTNAPEIAAYLEFDGPSGWDEWDTYFYHAHTGERLHQVRQEDKSPGEKWRNSNYAIHVGDIYGLPTKLLAFAVSLFCAGLPVSGFLIWWGRRRKG